MTVSAPVVALSNTLAFWLFTLTLMLILMAITFVNISVMAFVQGIVPGQILGKIIALIVTVVNFASPLGSLGFGVVLEHTVEARWLMFVVLAVLTMGIVAGAKRVFVSTESDDEGVIIGLNSIDAA